LIEFCLLGVKGLLSITRAILAVPLDDQQLAAVWLMSCLALLICVTLRLAVWRRRAERLAFCTQSAEQRVRGDLLKGLVSRFCGITNGKDRARLLPGVKFVDPELHKALLDEAHRFRRTHGNV